MWSLCSLKNSLSLEKVFSIFTKLMTTDLLQVIW
uniref:Uncharacterized protein n=1 Tax=virus sp. ctBM815 TaxID=2825806 RepID=A0A8S5RKB2_9VIRU|nr:MAG TPA: hypothetical protein [virus sp. ctBM815]